MRAARVSLPCAVIRIAFAMGLALGLPTPTMATQTIPPAPPGQRPAESAQLDINTATIAELKALPGMGGAYARRIVEGRPYTAKNQLATRGVLPQAVYDGIRDRIVAHRPQSNR